MKWANGERQRLHEIPHKRAEHSVQCFQKYYPSSKPTDGIPPDV